MFLFDLNFFKDVENQISLLDDMRYSGAKTFYKRIWKYCTDKCT